MRLSILSAGILAAAMALQGGVSVVLHWQPPAKSSDAVVGYNVYRTDAGSSAWVKINKDLVHAATYTDKTAERGAAYSYSIRSVDAQGHESGPSEPWSVTIPKKGKKVVEATQKQQ
ncbi:MAG TPA: fibronectin type III domain-containing protein [Acidobacteriaceae bacterium]|nr:fibronectin type III domain-containing protein [Acidobacteriaceae bacterium]